MSTPQIVETSTPDVAAGNKITMVSINDGAGLASRQVVSIGDPTTGGQFAAVTAAGKLLVTPDSVALPANQSVNAAQIAGTAASVNSGAKDAGTLRVVLATDQPALTNKLLVTPDSVALPANQSVNAAQFGGTNVVTGTGVGGAGIPRVTVSSDSQIRPVDSAGADLTSAKGTQTARAVGTQDQKDSGRTYVCFTVDRAAGVAVEALLTLAINKGETTSSAASYTVTAGKTLRIQSISVSVRASTTTIVDARVRLVTAASAIAVGSPRLVALEAFANGAIAEDGNTVTMDFPDGIEIAAGHQVAVSNIESTATGTVSVTVVGYEY